MVQRHEQRCFHSEILQAVVRRLRTTPRKLSHSDSTVCAFAPRRRDRGQLGRGEESCIIIHHDKWLSITPGKVNMLVLHPPENASDIPWCKDTNGGVSPWDSAGCGAFHPEILQAVVQRLRTTHRQLLPSDSTVCAFAPPEKRPRSVGPWRGQIQKSNPKEE